MNVELHPAPGLRMCQCGHTNRHHVEAIGECWAFGNQGKAELCACEAFLSLGVPAQVTGFIMPWEPVRQFVWQEEQRRQWRLRQERCRRNRDYQTHTARLAMGA